MPNHIAEIGTAIQLIAVRENPALLRAAKIQLDAVSPVR